MHGVRMTGLWKNKAKEVQMMCLRLLAVTLLAFSLVDFQNLSPLLS